MHLAQVLSPQSVHRLAVLLLQSEYTKDHSLRSFITLFLPVVLY